MKLAIYNDIIHLIHAYKTRDSLPIISERFPGVSMNTLGSIFSQDYQRKMRKTHHLHYSSAAIQKYYDSCCIVGKQPVNYKEYYAEYWKRELQESMDRFCQDREEGKQRILISLADEFDLSPALLGRIILERQLSVVRYDGETAPKSVVSQYMKEPSLIEDPMLAVEIQQCILYDDHYGPLCDSIKQSIGHEYEFKLKRTLSKLGLSFIGEDQMRTQGYDKTPDIKLEVPIAVDGHVVNWIESKASFGDEHSHKTYLKDQFWSYWNRFGPGMVIYWFGFIDELDINQDKGILLRDCFPEDIVKMEPCKR